jgi:MOSC domain-containing protein YiiM
MSLLLSVQVGPIAPLGPRGVPSGFVKHPVAGPVALGPSGLAGDQQADRSVHGGADKAVYGYAAESYALWRDSHPRHAALWQPGGLGENLTFAGLSEATLCIGDTLRVGAALLQITQPREPCFKLALRFDDPQLGKAMIRNGRTGWYFRVLAAGMVTAGDPAVIEHRPNPNWPVSRMNAFIVAKRKPRAQAMELAALPGLAASWRARLGKLLASADHDPAAAPAPPAPT